MIRYLLLIIFTWSLSAWSFDWQGHRGARGLYPENTIGAMEEALKYPVTTLELDVVVSKDKQVVVSHEPWMSDEICQDPKGNRVSGKKHNLYKLNYDEIIKYDCGTPVHPRFPHQLKVSVGKPLLSKLIDSTEETLAKLNRKSVGYSIEIKSTIEDEKAGYQPNYKEFSDLVIKLINSKLKYDRYMIQSFDWRVLKYIHEKYPDVRLVALTEEKFEGAKVLKELGFKPTVFSPNYEDLKESDVKFFHSEGVKVIPWTVNDVKEMQKLRSMDVDGIITDYPNFISSVNEKLCSSSQNYFEGKCVEVPSHAYPSGQNPGWACKRGYIQKRSKCVKLVIPSHAVLKEDGKTWECKEGFERYRGTCKKIK